MPKIKIKNLFQREFQAEEQKTVLRNIHDQRIDWMYACGGKGRCTTCKMIVIEGQENISPLSIVEQRFRDTGRLSSQERLTCQCFVHGDIAIAVADMYKFPHVKYSE